ncbi:Protein of unknown function [Allochromatium warmingii]|uniref:DUF2835 domain-containing protein n=1 Tax=Allochromatium warmingii TaxID=61595 RepID=A0A1H3G7M4_ALLWA|nr:DUF2835 domain-containing protein [Allochromatium warmingii]SDX99057.1 Protein of unknown function [Allochromatium warmingii]
MRYFYFSLSIPRAEYLRYYQGAAARVVVRAQDGCTLSLPAINLRRFVSNAGVHGYFRAGIDENNRLVSLERQGV